jgi:hypothetical protein
MKTGLIPTALLFIFSNVIGQTSTFDQNSSRSNYTTRAYNQNNARSNHAKMMTSGFNFQLSPQYGINMKGDQVDSLLFRGNGPGFKMDASYSFGNFGFGVSSGFVSSQTDKTKINEFLSRNGIPFDQMIINTGTQQNMYVLLGPNASFGDKIRAGLHAKGGLFINNGGFINIKRQGAVNSIYRNEPSSKSIYPGFVTGVNVDYHLSDLLTIGFGTDYLNTKTEVVNYDTRRGAAIEGLKLSKNISNVMAGISIKYNIKSPRDAATGLATGRQLGKPKYEDISSRESQSGLATGKTNAQFNPKEYSIDKRADESCGPVTVKRTFGDGSTEEMTFACPGDAVNYAQRKEDYSERPTWTSSNSQRTFVLPHVLEKEGITQRDIAARNILIGKVTWSPSTGGNGIVTNKTVRGGGIRMNESQSATRTTPNNSFGTLVRLSAREAGSGMATGRRQYEPVFIEGQGPVCNPCLVTVNNPLYQESGMQGTNPMYENKVKVNNQDWADLSPGIEGLTISLVDISTNSVMATTRSEKSGDFFFANVPEGVYAVQVTGRYMAKKGYDFYTSSKTEMEADIALSGETIQLAISTGDNDNAPTQRAGISTSRSNIRTKTITLIDADTDGDGEFDSFVLTGILSDGSSRDLTNDAVASRVNKVDAFTIKQSAMKMNSFDSKPGNASKAAQLTSIVIDNRDDVDLKATATFSDGSSFDVTNAVEVKGWDYKVKQYNITVADLDGDGFGDAVAKITKSRSNIQNNRMVSSGQDDEEPLGVVKTKTKSNQSNDRMMNNPDDGEEPLGVIKTKTKSNQSNDRMMSNTEDNLIWSPRSNIDLYGIVAGDLDGDGRAEETLKITKSRSNIQNNRIMITDLDGDGLPEAIINTSRSNIKNLAVSTGDLDGDGKAEFVVGNMVPGGNILSSAMRPGDPIPDIDVILKKKNGGTEKQLAAGENGRIKVIGPDMEPDTYTMTVSTNIFINDQTIVVLGNDAGDEQRSKGVKQTMQQQVKWMAPEATQTAINTSHSNIKNMLTTLDEIDQRLAKDNETLKATINTTRSNIKGHQKALNDLDHTLEVLETMDKTNATSLLQEKMTTMDKQFISLQESLNNAGRQYTTVSNVLKTKHDTVKNSINNIR